MRVAEISSYFRALQRKATRRKGEVRPGRSPDEQAADLANAIHLGSAESERVTPVGHRGFHSARESSSPAVEVEIQRYRSSNFLM